MDPDDIVIQQMERKLKLKKRRKKKLPASFYEEGLGDILDFIDKRANASDLDEEYVEYKKRKVDNETPNEADDEVEEEEPKDDGDEIGTDFDDMADLDEEGGESEEEDNSDEEDKSDNEESSPELREDIYGNLRDKHGNIVPREKKAQEYLEELDKQVKPLDDQVLRRIRGLLNRITSSNLSYVKGQLQDLFQKYSRHEICQCITKCASDVLVRDICLSPQKLFIDFGTLVAALHASVGEEVGGHIVHAFVKKFDGIINEKCDPESKELDNVVAFLAHLYASGVVDAVLMFDIFKKLCSVFNEKCIELVILLLKLVGFVMRKDSPAQMKNLVILIRESATKSQFSSNKRISFMLDTLVAIKNNNILKVTSDNSPITAIDTQEIKTILKNCVKGSVDSLPGSYEEILAGSRWWVKTGQLIERNDPSTEKSDKAVHLAEFDANVNEEICRKLKLNTAIRKQLFQAIITSDDYIEACQRLLQLTKKQYSEVANVCLHIALHEKVFTLFYTCVFEHLSNVDRKYKLAIKFALKDKVEALHSLSKLQKNNLAKLLFELMKRNVVPITVLRGIEFCDIDETYQQFLSQVFQLLLKEDDEIIKNVFSKLSSKEKKDADFAASIKYFITIFNDSTFQEKMQSLSLPWKFKVKSKSFNIDI